MQPLTPTHCLRPTFLTFPDLLSVPRDPPTPLQAPPSLPCTETGHRAAAASSWSHSPKSSLDRGFLLLFGAAQHQKNPVAAQAGAPRCFEGKNTQRGRMLLVGRGEQSCSAPCKQRGQQQSEALLPNHSPTRVIGRRDRASSPPGAAVPTRAPQPHAPAASRGGLTSFRSSCSAGMGRAGRPPRGCSC